MKDACGGIEDITSLWPAEPRRWTDLVTRAGLDQVAAAIRSRRPLRLAFARSWGDVAKDTANCPVSQAALAEVPRLLQFAIVVVTEQTSEMHHVASSLLDQDKPRETRLAAPLAPHNRSNTSMHHLTVPEFPESEIRMLYKLFMLHKRPKASTLLRQVQGS